MDFIRGDVPLPPRLQEHGQAFAWNNHALGWWRRLTSSSLPSLFGSDSDSGQGGSGQPPTRSTTTTTTATATTTTVAAASSGSSVALLDFDATLADPIGTVRRLAEFLSRGTGHDDHTSAAAAAAAATTAAAIAKRVRASACDDPG